MPLESQIPTTYLGLFIALMMGMWGLIVFLVQAGLKNQSKTSESQARFATEVTNHMASANEILRGIVLEQARVQAQSGPLIADFGRLTRDTSEIKDKLLVTIIDLARASGAAQAYRASEREREASHRAGPQSVKIEEQPVKVEEVGQKP